MAERKLTTQKILEVDKIAKEILKDEVLSEEELDKVAGGTIAETVKDTQFLHALGLIDKAYTASEIQSNPKAVSRAINGVWEYGGALCQARTFEIEINPDGDNKYLVRAWENQNCPRDVMLKMIAEDAGQPDFDFSKFL